jgi:hypothetical protein
LLNCLSSISFTFSALGALPHRRRRCRQSPCEDSCVVVVH